jgi:hypothetical protein
MFTDADLHDPAPPVPGAAERAKVAARAEQIKRHRRVVTVGGALGVVAVLTLGVLLLNGASGDLGTSRVEVAGGDTQAVPKTPATGAYTVSGTVPGVPKGVTGTVRLVGDAGTFAAKFGSDGAFSIQGVPAGHYDADYSWSSTDGSASQAGRAPGGVDISGDVSVTFPADAS